MPSRHAATISPASRLRGRLRVPGDTSCIGWSSHRYAILAGLANCRSTLANDAPGADCRSPLACLRSLGVGIADASPGTITVMGRGIGRLCSPFLPGFFERREQRVQ